MRRRAHLGCGTTITVGGRQFPPLAQHQAEDATSQLLMLADDLAAVAGRNVVTQARILRMKGWTKL